MVAEACVLRPPHAATSSQCFDIGAFTESKFSFAVRRLLVTADQIILTEGGSEGLPLNKLPTARPVRNIPLIFNGTLLGVVFFIGVEGSLFTRGLLGSA